MPVHKDKRRRAEGARHARRPHQEFTKNPAGGAPGKGAFWLYGLHAAKAALANPNRNIRKIFVTERVITEISGGLPAGITPDIADPDQIAKLLPSGAVHQGIAMLCEPLRNPDLEEILGNSVSENHLIAVLDQVTDPHNEGAILRSAAAFGVSAVIVQDRHAPPESGALAKAASGALDIVPRISVVNIARALDDLADLDFWRIALSGEATASLQDAIRPGNIAIVLGAEGTGIRRLVRERCDTEASIPMSGAIESLNVSNAAAIAFYELRQKKIRQP